MFILSNQSLPAEGGGERGKSHTKPYCLCNVGISKMTTFIPVYRNHYICLWDGFLHVAKMMTAGHDQIKLVCRVGRLSNACLSSHMQNRSSHLDTCGGDMHIFGDQEELPSNYCSKGS